MERWSGLECRHLQSWTCEIQVARQFASGSKGITGSKQAKKCGVLNWYVWLVISCALSGFVSF